MKNSLDRCVARSPKLAWRTIDGEAVIVAPEEGMVTTFNKTASRIWELLDRDRRLDDIANIVAEEFEVDQKMVCQDLQEFVEGLLENNMVLSSEELVNNG